MFKQATIAAVLCSLLLGCSAHQDQAKTKHSPLASVGTVTSVENKKAEPEQTQPNDQPSYYR